MLLWQKNDTRIQNIIAVTLLQSLLELSLFLISPSVFFFIIIITLTLTRIFHHPQRTERPPAAASEPVYFYPAHPLRTFSLKMCRSARTDPMNTFMNKIKRILCNVNLYTPLTYS